MDKRVLFLKVLASEKIGRVKPQTSPESPYGYCYPEAQKAFETNPGEEIEDLEPLAEQGYLAREFHDKIHPVTGSDVSVGLHAFVENRAAIHEGVEREVRFSAKQPGSGVVSEHQAAHDSGQSMESTLDRLGMPL